MTTPSFLFRRAFILVALLGASATIAPLRAAEASTPKAKPVPNPALAPIVDVPGLPRVLLIGDSISIGYTLPVRAALKGKANVHRPPGNCSSTGYSLTKIDEWLGTGKWDVIHFNFGLHDAKLPPEGVRHAAPADYEKNLRQLVQRMKATGAKLIWATTTPVPMGGNLAPNRRFGDIATYNAIAAKVMAENGVAINDLNAAIAPHVEKVGRPTDVHFTEEGNALLAQGVAREVSARLRK
jgi:acyl-CoA thioesterase-1